MKSFILTGGRQSGKTYTIMQEIHNLILEGLRPSILLVFMYLSSAEDWLAMWNRLFPQQPMPQYTTIENRLGIRGRTFEYVYIEHVESLAEGVYDPRIGEIVMMNAGGVVTYTYSPTVLSLRSHSRIVDKEEIASRFVALAQNRVNLAKSI